MQPKVARKHKLDRLKRQVSRTSPIIHEVGAKNFLDIPDPRIHASLRTIEVDFDSSGGSDRTGVRLLHPTTGEVPRKISIDYYFSMKKPNL
jgi:hypothetical protein